jgi:hypothetical protein
MADLIQRREKEAMSYLLRQKNSRIQKKNQVPFLILLDINFSKKFFESNARITAKFYI